MATPLMVDESQSLYGTIATFRIKPGAEEALKTAASAWLDTSRHAVPSGFTGQYVYRMNGSDDLYSLVVIFANKADYEANAVSPEQHGRFLEFREFLQADPEWHDGEIVMAVTVDRIPN